MGVYISLCVVVCVCVYFRVGLSTPERVCVCVYRNQFHITSHKSCPKAFIYIFCYFSDVFFSFFYYFFVRRLRFLRLGRGAQAQL